MGMGFYCCSTQGFFPKATIGSKNVKNRLNKPAAKISFEENGQKSGLLMLMFFILMSGFLMGEPEELWTQGIEQLAHCQVIKS